MILYGSINGGIESFNPFNADFEFKIPQYDPWGEPTGDYKYLTCFIQNKPLVSKLCGKVENFAKIYVQGPVEMANHSILVKKIFIPKTFRFFEAK